MMRLVAWLPIWRCGIFWALSCAALADPAWSSGGQPEISQVVTQADLRIELSSKLKGDRDAWDQVCERLAKSLSVGQAVWGMGVFTEANCSRREAASQTGAGSASALWSLRVTSERNDLIFQLTDPRPGMSDRVVKLMGGALAVSELRDESLMALVSAAILYQMPMAMRISAEDIQQRGDGTSRMVRQVGAGGTKEGRPFAQPQPPHTLAIYQLEWDEVVGLWRPHLIGTAERLSRHGGEAIYHLNAVTTQALAAGPLWAHDTADLNARTQGLAEAARRRQEVLRDHSTGVGNLLIDAFSAGYVGFRYGFNQKIRFFGLLDEIRSGPLDGLRYNYDKMPKPTNVDTSNSEVAGASSFAWSRHKLGYSFFFKSRWLFDDLYVTPNLELWNMDATAQIAQDDGTFVPRVFHVVNALGFGIEAGVEWLSRWYTLRPWASYDRGFSVIRAGPSITGTRAGLDVYLNTGPSIALGSTEFKFALLMFVLGENVEVAASKGSSSLSYAVSSFGYTAGYVGLGAMLSW